MALALILAAFAGAALGLLWQSSDLAAEEGQPEGEDEGSGGTEDGGEGNG